MKKLLSLALLGFTAICSPAYASELNCQTDLGKIFAPRFSLTAQVSDEYRAGAELQELTNVEMLVGKQKVSLASVKIDEGYQPRKIPNRVRFDLGDIDAAEENVFDGIVHFLILPKTTKTATFTAIVVSSTDSYHDGINSYFPMDCTLR